MDPQLFLLYAGLVALPAIPLAVWKIFTLPPKVGPLDDVRTTMKYQERLNRKGVDAKPGELYAWLPGRTT